MELAEDGTVCHQSTELWEAGASVDTRTAGWCGEGTLETDPALQVLAVPGLQLPPAVAGWTLRPLLTSSPPLPSAPLLTFTVVASTDLHVCESLSQGLHPGGPKPRQRCQGESSVNLESGLGVQSTAFGG